jgi:hypothetical protein
MRNPTSAGAAVAALLVTGSQTFAADGTRRCLEIFDDPQRLACYDSLFGKPVRPRVAQAPAAPVPAPDPDPEPEPEPAQPVTARITAVSRFNNERFAITLDNGQLWTQLERDLAAEVRIGDTVQIRPAALGSWMLVTRGGVRTRVRLARP